MMLFLTTVIYYLALVLPLLLAIAFFTLVERHIIASVQRRQGPNVTGIFGLLQPVTDGVKLIFKESVLPKSSNLLIFFFAPIFTFGLALANWVVLPLGEGFALIDINVGILYIFALSSLGVHSIIMAGWSSNSKYAFLGALRSAAQMISYELSLGVTILSVLICAGTLNLTEIVLSQSTYYNFLILFPMFIVFYICALAETNRHPFDLPEAEAELVSGYNVEYSAAAFALFFLAEYANIMVMSFLTVIFFLGGWYAPFEFLNFIPGIFWIVLKALVFIVLFVLIRAVLPRYRYDQLMILGWKVFLPMSLSFFFLLANFLISFNLLNF